MAVLEAEILVGVGLDPDRLDERRAGTGVRLRRRAVVEPQNALRSLRERPGRRSSRSCRATGGAACLLRSRRARARRGEASPGARPRRPAANRACGSSARAAHGGTARRGRGKRPSLRGAASSTRGSGASATIKQELLQHGCEQLHREIVTLPLEGEPLGVGQARRERVRRASQRRGLLPPSTTSVGVAIEAHGSRARASRGRCRPSLRSRTAGCGRPPRGSARSAARPAGRPRARAAPPSPRA